MYRTRIHWFCILGIGVLSLVWSSSDLLAGGSEIAGIGELVGGVAITVGALYSLTHLNETSETTSRTVFFWPAVLGFVLVFAGTVLQFV